jgi:DNA-binding MarR family transcriptional regulator
MSTKWLNDIEMAAWLTYISTVDPLRAALDADLQPHGLTLGDYEVLAFLSEHDDHRMRMTELAGLLRLSPSGLTRRIDGLVRQGYVERVSCPSDRRVAYSSLTDAGFARLKEIAPVHVASVRRHFLQALDTEQMETIAAVFCAIRTRLGVADLVNT